MSQMVSMAAQMWTHVGPGLLFAVALPVLLILFALVARTGYRRVATAGKQS